MKSMLSAGLDSLLRDPPAGGENRPPEPGSLEPSSIPNALLSWEKQKEAKRAWREKNKEYVKQYHREWKSRNPEKVRAQRRGVTPSELIALMASQRGACNFCGGDLAKSRHLDHKTPRSRGGSNEVANYQYLCPPCNTAKGVFTTEEFLVHIRKVLLHVGG